MSPPTGIPLSREDRISQLPKFAAPRHTGIGEKEVGPGEENVTSRHSEGGERLMDHRSVVKSRAHSNGRENGTRGRDGAGCAKVNRPRVDI